MKIRVLLAPAIAVYLIAAAPEQPVPFNHKQHAAVGLQCRQCHAKVTKSERAGLPDAAQCMGCHSEIRKDSPAIQKLAAFHKEEKPLPWARVYRIPDFIFFSHAKHVAGKVACSECHGPVEQREILATEVTHNMKTCMDCHRTRKVSNNCHTCHELGE